MRGVRRSLPRSPEWCRFQYSPRCRYTRHSIDVCRCAAITAVCTINREGNIHTRLRRASLIPQRGYKCQRAADDIRRLSRSRKSDWRRRRQQHHGSQADRGSVRLTGRGDCDGLFCRETCGSGIETGRRERARRARRHCPVHAGAADACGRKLLTLRCVEAYRRWNNENRTWRTELIKMRRESFDCCTPCRSNRRSEQCW